MSPFAASYPAWPCNGCFLASSARTRLEREGQRGRVEHRDRIRIQHHGAYQGEQRGSGDEECAHRLLVAAPQRIEESDEGDPRAPKAEAYNKAESVFGLCYELCGGLEAVQLREIRVGRP